MPKILIGKPKGIKLMSWFRNRKESKINYIKEIYSEDVYVIHLIQKRFQWQALIKKTTDIHSDSQIPTVPENADLYYDVFHS